MPSRTERLNFILSSSSARFVKGIDAAVKAFERLDAASASAVGTLNTAFTRLEAGTASVGTKITAAFNQAQTAITSNTQKILNADKRLQTGLAQGASKTVRAFRQVERASDASAKVVSKGFTDAEKVVDRATKRMVRGVLNINTAIAGLAAGAGAAAPVKFAADFQTALANVDTLLVDAGVGIERYEGQLLKLAESSSKELIDLTQGLYQTISAGIPAVEGAGGAFDVLSKAQRAAVAGLATTEQAVGAFTTVLNAYAGSGLTATEVSDKLFTTVRVGRTTFPELASGIGRVATVAAKFGIDIDQTLGSLASLTKAGLSTDEAVTALRSTIIALSKPTDRARKIFDELGVAIGEDAFKEQGLQGVLAAISTATGDSADAIAEMIPNVRALVGSLVLGADGAKNLERDLNSLRNSTGATDAAYAKIARTFNETAKIFKSQLQNVFIAAGKEVLPRIQEQLKKLGDFLIANQTQIKEAFTSFVDTLFSIGQFIGEYGDKILTFMVSVFVVGRIAAATAALQKFAAALVATSVAAQAGAGAGAAFATGFQKAVRTLPALISNILRSPGALALFIGVGLVIGKIIGDAVAEEVEKELERAEKELADLRRRGEDAAKKLGFRSQSQALEERAARNRGERIVTGPRRQDSKTPSEQLAELDAVGLTAEESAARLRELADAERGRLIELGKRSANEAKETAAQITNLLEQRNRLAQGRGILDEDEFAASERRIEAQSNQLAKLRAREAELKSAAQKVVDITESAIEDRDFAKAEAEADKARDDAARRRARAAAAAARASQEERDRREQAERSRIKLIGEAEQAELDLLEARVAADTARFEVRRGELAALNTLELAEIGERQAKELAALQENAASASEILEARKQQRIELDDAAIAGAERQLEFLNEELALIGRVRVARVDALQEAARVAEADAKREGDLLATEFARGSAKRISIEQATTKRILAIREQLALETEGIEGESAARVAEIQVASAAEVQKKTAAERDKTDAQREATLLEQAEVAANVARDPLSALKDAGGTTGEVAGAIELVSQLPAIIDGLTSYLSGEFLEQFIESLVVAIGRFFTVGLAGFAQRIADLPQKIVDRLPPLISEFISRLPEVIAYFITTFVPNMVKGLLLSLPAVVAALTIGLVDGFKSLLDDFKDFLGGDFLEATGVLLFEAVASLGEIILQALKDIGGGIIGGALDFVEGIPGVGAVVRKGREFVSGAADFVTGGFVDIFHSGGMVGSGRRNPALAAQFSLGGAQRFAEGGMVQRLSDVLRGQVPSAQIDDIPAVLQAGEGVLTRRGVAAAGGPNGISRLNMGLPGIGGGGVMTLQPIINARGGALEALMRAVIGSMSMEVVTPGSQMRTALDEDQAYPGIRMVRGRT